MYASDGLHLSMIPDAEVVSQTAKTLVDIEHHLGELKRQPLRGLLFLVWDEDKTVAYVAGPISELRTALTSMLEQIKIAQSRSN